METMSPTCTGRWKVIASTAIVATRPRAPGPRQHRAAEVHLRHQPAAEDVAVGVGIRRHRQGLQGQRAVRAGSGHRKGSTAPGHGGFSYPASAGTRWRGARLSRARRLCTRTRRWRLQRARASERSGTSRRHAVARAGKRQAVHGLSQRSSRPARRLALEAGAAILDVYGRTRLRGEGEIRRLAGDRGRRSAPTPSSPRACARPSPTSRS